MVLIDIKYFEIVIFAYGWDEVIKKLTFLKIGLPLKPCYFVDVIFYVGDNEDIR